MAEAEAVVKPVDILLTVVKAIGTSGALAIVGVIVTRRGYITDGVRKGLAELSMNLLMPCLLFTKMVGCPEFTPCNPIINTVKEAWILVVWPLFVVGSGMALGKLVAVTTKCPRNFSRACVGCVAFANSTGLPITILEVLSPSLLRAGIIDKSPLKILPVYLLLYPMLTWTFGSYLFGLLGSKKPKPEEPEAPGDNELDDAMLATGSMGSRTATATLQGSRTATATLQAIGASFLDPMDMDLAAEPDIFPPDQPTPFISHHPSQDPVLRRAYSHGEELGGLPLRTSQSNDRGRFLSAPGKVQFLLPDQAQPDQGNKEETSSESGSEGSDYAGPSACRACCRMFRAKMRTVRKVIRNVLVPPVVGSALGLIVALIRPLQAVFVSHPALGPNAPLDWLFQAMVCIGRASVPINMLVLGSNLSKGCDFNAVPLATNFGILFARYIGQPLIMCLVIAAMSRMFGMNDLAIWVVGIIVSCTPTANNIMVMVELSGQNKPGVTACIFTQYMAAPFFLTGVVTGFILLKDVIAPQ